MILIIYALSIYRIFLNWRKLNAYSFPLLQYFTKQYIFYFQNSHISFIIQTMSSCFLFIYWSYLTYYFSHTIQRFEYKKMCLDFNNNNATIIDQYQWDLIAYRRTIGIDQPNCHWDYSPLYFRRYEAIWLNDIFSMRIKLKWKVQSESEFAMGAVPAALLEFTSWIWNTLSN